MEMLVFQYTFIQRKNKSSPIAGGQFLSNAQVKMTSLWLWRYVSIIVPKPFKVVMQYGRYEDDAIHNSITPI